MKSYKVTVNGVVYNVDVEVTDAEQTHTAPVYAQAPAVRPAAAAVPAASAQIKAAPPANAEKVASPLPGSILKIHVKEGDNVKRGDPTFVIEAMKMENEIVSTVTGKVASVNVSVGTAVQSGDTLMTVVAG